MPAALLLAAVSLLSQTAASSRPADRFAAAGVSEASVRQAFEALQSGVRAGDPGPVADLIFFPLRVNHPDGRREVIEDRAQFVARFSGIFGGKMREVILAQRFDELFASAHGIMLGSGDLWLSGICEQPGCTTPRVAIIAINTP